MKLIFVAIVATAVASVALPAFAQTSPGSRNWAGTPTNNTNAAMGPGAGGDTRLNGMTRDEYIASLVAKDREQIAEINRQIKATDDEAEKKRLKGLKRQLENDIIALQQS